MKTLTEHLKVIVEKCDLLDSEARVKAELEAAEAWLLEFKNNIDTTQRGIPASPTWHFNRGKYAQLVELLEELKQK